MELNLENLKKTVNTPTVKSLVSSWLMQKALAEILREQVNAVYLEVMREIPIFSDYKTSARRMGDGSRIFDPNHMYLSTDEESCQKIYDRVEILTRERGIKPPEMKDGFCPALVAESDLTKIEHLIISETGDPFGITIDKLFASADGIERYHKFLDLIIGAIVNQPDFKNPIK